MILSREIHTHSLVTTLTFLIKPNFASYDYGGSNGKCPHRLLCLNAWSQQVCCFEDIVDRLRGGALLTKAPLLEEGSERS